MKAALFIASALLLLATVSNAAKFLCELPEDKVMPALECIQQNASPGVASYLGRLPENLRTDFVRKACNSGTDLEEIMRSVWTDDFFEDLTKAVKACEGKF